MNKVIPILALCTVAAVTTLLLNGCGSAQATNANEKSKPVHLSTFLSLHNQFCEKKYNSSESLINELKASKKLTLAKDFEGVYEVLIGNISFAVSPEEDGCTTDVMLKKGEDQLFNFEDINRALISIGYVETGDPVSRKDRGTDQSEVTVIEKKYISPNGEVTTLDFPLEKQDKYYMTLFAEKFTEAKREIKEKALQTLKMASL